MKASFCLLSAVIAVCVTHAAALAQSRGRPNRWPPHDPSAGARPSYSPFDPSSPGGVRNPFDPPSSGEWQSPLGSYRAVPPEPGVGASIDHGRNGNPNPGTPAQILPEQFTQQYQPPKIGHVPLPVVAPARYEPPAAPSWQGLEWAAAGIVVLGLLALLLRGSVERRREAR